MVAEKQEMSQFMHYLVGHILFVITVHFFIKHRIFFDEEELDPDTNIIWQWFFGRK